MNPPPTVHIKMSLLVIVSATQTVSSVTIRTTLWNWQTEVFPLRPCFIVLRFCTPAPSSADQCSVSVPDFALKSQPWLTHCHWLAPVSRDDWPRAMIDSLYWSVTVWHDVRGQRLSALSFPADWASCLLTLSALVLHVLHYCFVCSASWCSCLLMLLTLLSLYDQWYILLFLDCFFHSCLSRSWSIPPPLEKYLNNYSTDECVQCFGLWQNNCKTKPSLCVYS